MNNKALTIYQFEKQDMRTFLDENGDPWFVAADVCAALGITNEQTRRLDDDEKGLHSIQTPGGTQSVVIVNESGLYSLVLGSRKPEAKAFKRWVTHEVLPALRKTGTYSLQASDPLAALEQTVAALRWQANQLKEHDNRIARIEARQTAMENGAGYFTILAYARLYGHHISLETARALGVKAARLSRERGYDVGKAPDQRHGEVGTYHEDILAEVFAKLK